MDDKASAMRKGKYRNPTRSVHADYGTNALFDPSPDRWRKDLAQKMLSDLNIKVDQDLVVLFRWIDTQGWQDVH